MKIDVKGAIVQNEDKWIYDWWGMDAACPRDVIEKLEKANGEPVDVYINSGGGDILAGSEIFAALQTYEGALNIHVVGMAGSAASIIACAGESDIVTTGLYMVHCVSGGIRGNKFDAEEYGEILDTADRAFASAYMQKTGKSEEEVLAMMERNRGGGKWFTAKEAVEHGLIDRVTGTRMTATVAPMQMGAGHILPDETLQKMRMLLRKGEPQVGTTPPKDDTAERVARAKMEYLKLGGKLS